MNFSIQYFFRFACVCLLLIAPGLSHEVYSNEQDQYNARVDSIKKALVLIKEPSKKLEALIRLTTEQINAGLYPAAFQSALQAKALSESLKDKKQLAVTYNNLGLIEEYNGDYEKALKHYIASATIREEIKDQNGLAHTYNNMGVIYLDKGDYGKALEYYLKSLKIDEGRKDKRGMAESYVNIGAIYAQKNEYEKALGYYEKSLVLLKNLDHNKLYASCLNNIGSVHYYKNDNEKAMEFYTRALEVRLSLGDQKAIASSYNNLGSVSYYMEDYDKALDYFLKSLKIREDLGDKVELASSYHNIAALYMLKDEARAAREWELKSLKVAKEVDSKPDIVQAYGGLSAADSALGNFRSAFDNYRLYIMYNDSLNNAESEKKLMQVEIEHEYEKKEAISKAEQKKNELLYQAEIDKQTTQRNGFVAGCILMIALAGVSYRSYYQKRKSHQEISLQKQLVEEKNKDIVDSINYAKRIQQALLKEQDHVSPHLPEHFILFQPKDIVSGDFYWSFERNDYWYIAAADCTGHGVPGGFMSMLGIAFLNEVSATSEVPSTSEILNKLREKIIKELRQTGKSGESKDGMDISLARIHLPTSEMVWSGANNPLWIINSITSEFKEIKADKQPIGFHYDPVPFSDHYIKLQKGDTFYLFTDGYSDQFGGPKGKKFKYSQLRELLIAGSPMQLSEQKRTLHDRFNEWKGPMEQVDDVCIIGVRV